MRSLTNNFDRSEASKVYQEYKQDIVSMIKGDENELWILKKLLTQEKDKVFALSASLISLIVIVGTFHLI